MGECPAGYEIRAALGNMTCRSCGCQCMIKYLKRQIEDLDEKLTKLKSDMD
ncbi:MAG: hypothetical protein KKH29_02070 [Candidatus Omnitrophica bacterium]|nr:hypothetical protein [Candidatus Omnitrophota bacterium]